MDELKLHLSTRFMRGVLAKLLSKMIKKKLGYDINIHFNEINLDMVDGETHVQLSVDANMNSDEFKKLLKSISDN